ncbi:MAG: hypothetical protein C4346_11430 [Chloroflexota bacterium]
MITQSEERSSVAAARRLPFAARVQGILIVVMVAALALIAQQASKPLYQVGLPVLVIAAFLQIAFGNIPPSAGFWRSLKLLVLTWLIVAGVFALGIQLAPTLIAASRGG